MSKIQFVFLAITTATLISCKKAPETQVNSLDSELEYIAQLQIASKDAPKDDACDWFYHNADSIVKTISKSDTIYKNKNLMKVYYAESMYMMGMYYRTAVSEYKLEKMEKLRLHYDDKKEYSNEDLIQARNQLTQTVEMFD